MSDAQRGLRRIIRPDDREELAAAKQATANVIRHARARQRRLNGILIGSFLPVYLVGAWA